MITDFEKAPYKLSDEDIVWVKETIEGMFVEEKNGQLFIILGKSSNEEYVRDLVEKYHIGGARFVERDSLKILHQNRNFQKS